jgi:hypothetical protein
MEHENGSDHEPAVPRLPDQLSSPLPAEGAEAAGPAEPREPTESSETAVASETAEPSETAATFETAPASETAAHGDPADSEQSGKMGQATGAPRVDAALGRLGELDELPVSEHPAVYERVHEQLVDVLGELHQGTQNR